MFSFGVVLPEILTGEPSTDSKKKPPNLHARVIGKERLLREPVALGDPLARWEVPQIDEFAKSANDSVNPDIEGRPTPQNVVERLSALAARPELNQPMPAATAPAAREYIMCMSSER